MNLLSPRFRRAGAESVLRPVSGSHHLQIALVTTVGVRASYGEQKGLALITPAQCDVLPAEYDRK
jgi:hypothetical protein